MFLFGCSSSRLLNSILILCMIRCILGHVLRWHCSMVLNLIYLLTLTSISTSYLFCLFCLSNCTSDMWSIDSITCRFSMCRDNGGRGSVGRFIAFYTLLLTCACYLPLFISMTASCKSHKCKATNISIWKIRLVFSISSTSYSLLFAIRMGFYLHYEI